MTKMMSYKTVIFLLFSLANGRLQIAGPGSTKKSSLLSKSSQKVQQYVVSDIYNSLHSDGTLGTQQNNTTKQIKLLLFAFHELMCFILFENFM